MRLHGARSTPARRHAWRFLTPEVERLAPVEVAALARAAGEDREPAAEEARIDALVTRGRAAEWLAYLREVRLVVERAAARGADRHAVHRVACMLQDQYLLAPSVLELDARDRAEAARLDALVRAVRPDERPPPPA